MGRPSTEKPASNFATAQADTKPNARLATRILRQSYSLRIKERTARKKNEVANLRDPSVLLFISLVHVSFADGSGLLLLSERERCVLLTASFVVVSASRRHLLHRPSRVDQAPRGTDRSTVAVADVEKLHRFIHPGQRLTGLNEVRKQQ